MLMSVLKGQISVPRIVTTSSARTHAAAILAMLSMLMAFTVMILMSVQWVLISAPRIARTPLASILVAVAVGIDWMWMVVAVMV